MTTPTGRAHDREIETRQGEIARTLAVRASGLASDLSRAYSGETMDIVALVGGLQSLRAGLDLVEQMLAGERRPAAGAEPIAVPEPGAEPDLEAADPEPPRRRCKCCRGSIPAGIPTAKYYSGACRQTTALAPARAQQKAGTPLMGAAIVLALILAGTAADHAAICR